VAVGFIALGGLALWRARVLMRRHTQAR
jgi:hypothetical protein